MKCADCDHKYCEFCNAGDKYQKNAKSNVVTNFDRIKAMSVEGMAEFLFTQFDTDHYHNIWIGNTRMLDETDVKEWLESEVQEDE